MHRDNSQITMNTAKSHSPSDPACHDLSHCVRQWRYPWFYALVMLTLTLSLNFGNPNGAVIAENDFPPYAALVEHCPAVLETLANHVQSAANVIIGTISRHIGIGLALPFVLNALCAAPLFFLAYRLSLHLGASPAAAKAGGMAASLSPLIVFPLINGWRSDPLCVVLVLGALVAHFGEKGRHQLFAGLLIATAAWFRFHYFAIVIILLGSAILTHGSFHQRCKRAGWLLAGAAGGLVPLFLLGKLIPTVSSGKQLEVLSWIMFQDRDWFWFGATSSLHSTAEILGHPELLVSAIMRHALRLPRTVPLVLTAFISFPVCWLRRKPMRRRVLTVFMTCCVCIAIVLITPPTSRSALLATVLAGCCTAAWLFDDVRRAFPSRATTIAVAVVVLVALFPFYRWHRLLPVLMGHFQTHGLDNPIVTYLRNIPELDPTQVYAITFDANYMVMDRSYHPFTFQGTWLERYAFYRQRYPAPDYRTPASLGASLLAAGYRYLILDRKLIGEAPALPPVFAGEESLPGWHNITPPDCDPRFRLFAAGPINSR